MLIKSDAKLCSHILYVVENRSLKAKTDDWKQNLRVCTNVPKNYKSKSSLEREDVLLLLVAVGDVAVAVGQVEQRLVVVGRGGVLGVLVETNLPFVQDAVQVDP